LNETEGVVKYQLDYKEAPPVSSDAIREINAWRRIFFLLEMIGQDPARYGGFGYGNVSCRLEHNKEAFLITGTQTGHIPNLGAEHYTTVTMCDPENNHTIASGPVEPSSEALTHGSLYQADQSIQFVFHAHSPDIWRNAGNLDLPTTSPDINYGTPEMARAFTLLLSDKAARSKSIIAMGGHEDGVVAYASTAESAGSELINCFSRSLQLTGS
jgi:hypothetical protein